MKLKLFKSVVAISTTLTTIPLATIGLTSCGGGSTPAEENHITIPESEKSKDVGSNNYAIYTITLKETVSSVSELDVSANTSDTSYGVHASIESLKDSTLKIKVTAIANQTTNSTTVAFSLTVKTNSWSQTISNLTMTGLEDIKTTYTISYTTIPTGITLTSKPTSVTANSKVTVTYTLSDGYYINSAGCKVMVGSNDVTNKCTLDQKSLTIPSSCVTGNIKITLAVTEEQKTYTVAYNFDENITGVSCPDEAKNTETFIATYTIANGYKLNLNSCKVIAGTTNITSYVSFSNGKITIPMTGIIGNITITLISTEDSDTGSVEVTVGEKYILTTTEIKEQYGIDIYGVQKVVYLVPTNKQLTATISGEFTDTVIYMGTAKSTYNITLNNATISNGASDNSLAAPVFLAKSKNTSTINLTLVGTNKMLDKRTDTSADYYDDDAVVKSQSALNISGEGSLAINDLNTNKGIYGKGIQTTKGSPLTISSGTVNAFANDTAIQADGLLTISGGNVTADSYLDDGIKTKFNDPVDDFANDGTFNYEKDIVISGGTVNIYSARNGINSAHDVITSSSAKINIFTTKTNAGTKVGSATLDELNMFVRIPASYVTYSELENYFYTVTFNDGTVEYLTLKKIKAAQGGPGQQGSCYYYFKCDRPLSSSCSSFVINKYEKTSFGAETMTPVATSSSITISNPTSTTNTSDTVAVNQISGSTISTSSSLSINYKQDIGQGSSIDTTVGSKGIKAKDEVMLNGGTITIKSNDTGISAGYGNIFCNSETAGDVSCSSGNVTINGADVTIASNSGDGIKAYGIAETKNGTLTVTNSVEALEGGKIVISGGVTKLTASDDGVNASEVGLWNTYSSISSNKVTILVSGGVLDVQTNSNSDTDAIDSNNDLQITGGLIVARVPGSNPSSAIDTESKTLTASGGTIVVCGNIEPSISGLSKNGSGSWYSAKSYTITYNGSSTYSFTNSKQMNSSCKWYSNSTVSIS